MCHREKLSKWYCRLQIILQKPKDLQTFVIDDSCNFKVLIILSLFKSQNLIDLSICADTIKLNKNKLLVSS